MSQDIAAPAAQHQFGVGKVLATSFDIYGRNFIVFSILAVVVQIPSLILQLTMNPLFGTGTTTPLPGESGGFFLYLATVFLVGAILNGLVTATLIYGSFQYLRGQKAGLGESLSRAATVMVPIIIGAIWYSLIMSLGMVLLLIPGLMIMVIYWLYAPAIVVEKIGVGAAFTRSADLTRGKRWPIFGLVLILGITLYVVGLVVGLAISGLAITSPAVAVIAGYIINSLVGAFISVATAVTYYYLRADKEGVDIDDIAKLFD